MRAPDLRAVRDAVAEGELEDALKQLGAAAMTTKLKDEVTVHTFHLKDLGRRERQGVVDPREARVERSRLAYALLELASVIEKAQTGRSTPAMVEPAPDAATLEKLFGPSKLRSTSWLEEGIRVARSVCRIVAPEWFGSGFVAAPGIIATNYHVIATAEEAALMTIEMNYEEDARGNLRKVSRYKLDPATFRANEALDLAVCAVMAADDDPFDVYPPLELRTDAPAEDEEMTIIQHPDGRTKQIALSASPLIHVYEHRLQYLTQTLPGSSGSPVFDERWRVVAVHHAGGDLVTNSAGQRGVVNEGILARYLLELLS